MSVRQVPSQSLTFTPEDGFLPPHTRASGINLNIGEKTMAVIAGMDIPSNTASNETKSNFVESAKTSFTKDPLVVVTATILGLYFVTMIAKAAGAF